MIENKNKDGVIRPSLYKDFDEVLTNTIKRKKKLGAVSLAETIYLLEKEIEGYRETIRTLQENKNTVCESLKTVDSANHIVMKAKNIHVTIYPESMLRGE